MASNSNDGSQLLRNLASALREQQKHSPELPKLPTATDQDILRAMLGKTWGTRPADQTPVRKAG
jgi:hypothetical protein